MENPLIMAGPRVTAPVDTSRYIYLPLGIQSREY